jgi:hypothetical protein
MLAALAVGVTIFALVTQAERTVYASTFENISNVCPTDDSEVQFLVR